jgi:hypothetical protein
MMLLVLMGKIADRDKVKAFNSVLQVQPVLSAADPLVSVPEIKKADITAIIILAADKVLMVKAVLIITDKADRGKVSVKAADKEDPAVRDKDKAVSAKAVQAADRADPADLADQMDRAADKEDPADLAADPADKGKDGRDSAADLEWLLLDLLLWKGKVL